MKNLPITEGQVVLSFIGAIGELIMFILSNELSGLSFSIFQNIGMVLLLFLFNILVADLFKGNPLTKCFEQWLYGLTEWRQS